MECSAEQEAYQRAENRGSVVISKLPTELECFRSSCGLEVQCPVQPSASPRRAFLTEQLKWCLLECLSAWRVAASATCDGNVLLCALCLPHFVYDLHLHWVLSQRTFSRVPSGMLKKIVCCL